MAESSEIKRQTAGRGQMAPAGHLQNYGSFTDSMCYQKFYFSLWRGVTQYVVGVAFSIDNSGKCVVNQGLICPTTCFYKVLLTQPHPFMDTLTAFLL